MSKRFTGVPRADGVGFRYRRTKQSYTGNAEADRMIGEEFEQIAAKMGEALSRLTRGGDDGEGLTPAELGGASFTDKDTDQLVAISELDHEPDFLLYKLIEGYGISLEVTSAHRRGGLSMKISLDPQFTPTIWHKLDFNTWLDENGNRLSRYLPDDGSGVRQPNPKAHLLIVNHAIPHPHYAFDVYRPEETATQPTTVDYHPPDDILEGDDRGRYEIRWQVVERDAYRLVLRFHQPEYGTVLIHGPSTI